MREAWTVGKGKLALMTLTALLLGGGCLITESALAGTPADPRLLKVRRYRDHQERKWQFG